MASAYTRFVSALAFPFHERLKGHETVAVRRALEASQWWKGDRLAAYQLLRLRNLLQYAEVHVPYYRETFATHGLNVGDIRSLDVLQRLPFLTKPLIRHNFDRLTSDSASGLARFNTGGSSGEPLVFLIGRERVSHDVAAKWRATRWWGVDIGDPEIVVWGSPIELLAQDRVRRIRDRILRTELVPAFDMSEAMLDQALDRVRRRRPKMLFGYPSSLSLIAKHAEKRSRRMDDLGVTVAFVTSERLYDEQREIIGRVFGCSVANGYGGRDAGFIAHECPSGSMHVTAEDLVLEIVAPDGSVLPPGRSGEIAVTHLATRDFPFIRYRTGDIGMLAVEPCTCGRGLPVLKEIQGRSTDFVRAADGTVMHGLALIYVLRDLPGIESFKLIQESLALMRVLVVRGPQFSDRTRQAIEEGLKRRLGRGVEIRIEFMEAIPAEASGKYRYVVSKVAGSLVPDHSAVPAGADQ